AYTSTESGLTEVYVQAFPGPGGKWQISTGGGEFPVWSRNGRELYYYQGTRLMAVPITAQPAFAAGSPQPLFEARSPTLAASTTSVYDVAPDGRFILARGTGAESGSSKVHVVLNWMEELKRSNPAAKN